jgi:hypothetical protein
LPDDVVLVQIPEVRIEKQMDSKVSGIKDN